MNTLEDLEQRHSVRSYTDEAVDGETLARIQHEIEVCNAASGLHIQMTSGLDDAFMGCKTHYGRFRNVHNAIVLIGKGKGLTGDELKHAATSGTAEDADEIALQTNVGYWGEHLSVFLVSLGLATSWAVLDNATDGWWDLNPGEHIIWVLAFGHPAGRISKCRSKAMTQLCEIPDDMSLDCGCSSTEANSTGTGSPSVNLPSASSPNTDKPGTTAAPTQTAGESQPAPQWFLNGMQAAMRAPTSLNQQPFVFTLHSGTNGEATVSARASEGLFAHVGLGCAMYNFEIGAGPEHFNQLLWRTANQQ